MKRIFRALQHRNFRLFFLGQNFSLIGTWMQVVAGSWLVYRLTNSPFILGCAAFALNVPTLMFSPFAGVVADRFDRRRILIIIQSLSMVQAAVIWVLVMLNLIQVWHILVLSFLLGVLNAFELPIRQAFLSEMVDNRKDLPNAIALNSSVFNASRLIGPAVAGLLIAVWGEATCFLLNALSFIPLIMAFGLMRITPRTWTQAKAGEHPLAVMAEGMRYAYNSMPIRAILLLLSALSMLSGVFFALIPVFAKEVFAGGPKTMGFLLSFSGVGATMGAFYLAGRRTIIGLGRIIGLAAAGAGVALFSFAFAGHIASAAVSSLASGAFMILAIGSMNIVIQTLVDEDKRGRVMSLYGIALVGTAPIGSLIAGALAVRVGIVVTLAGAGALCVAAAVMFWRGLPRFRSIVRPIYASKGIYPQVEGP